MLLSISGISSPERQRVMITSPQAIVLQGITNQQQFDDDKTLSLTFEPNEQLDMG